MREESHSCSVKHFVCFLTSILWFELQNEGCINAWTFARACFVYASQHFRSSWKQFYFLSSLHFRIETSLSSPWFFLPGFHSSLGRHLKNCQKQGTTSIKSWPGKQKAVIKKKQWEVLVRPAIVTLPCFHTFEWVFKVFHLGSLGQWSVDCNGFRHFQAQLATWLPLGSMSVF